MLPGQLKTRLLATNSSKQVSRLWKDGMQLMTIEIAVFTPGPLMSPHRDLPLVFGFLEVHVYKIHTDAVILMFINNTLIN